MYQLEMGRTGATCGGRGLGPLHPTAGLEGALEQQWNVEVEQELLADMLPGMKTDRKDKSRPTPALLLILCA